jgi:hypothetical protein
MTKTSATQMISLGFLALSLLPACAPGESTEGELGRVQFSYGASCLFGCGLDEALLEGSTERIDVTGPGDAGGIQARSDSTEVASFQVSRSCACTREGPNWSEGHSVAVDAACDDGWVKECNNAIHVSAHSEGDTRLTLLDAQGAIVDSATVRVRRAQEVRFAQVLDGHNERPEISGLSLAVGETRTVSVQVFDADGQQLLARDGLSWSTSDAAVVAFPTFVAPEAEPGHDRAIVSLQGMASGTATLSVVASGRTGVLPVNVAE